MGDLYFQAVNKLKNTPHKLANGATGPGKNLYDAFVMIHGEGDNKKYAHQTAGFLAWHRKYLLEFEEALRSLPGDAKPDEYKCVTIPFWDWSTEAYSCKQKKGKGRWKKPEDCETYHDASDTLTDFGGPGNENKRGEHGSSGSGPIGCVTNGPFANWVDHNGKCLSRGVNWNVKAQKPFTGRLRLAKIIAMEKYGNQRDPDGFRVVFEG